MKHYYIQGNWKTQYEWWNTMSINKVGECHLLFLRRRQRKKQRSVRRTRTMRLRPAETTSSSRPGIPSAGLATSSSLGAEEQRRSGRLTWQ